MKENEINKPEKFGFELETGEYIVCTKEEYDKYSNERKKEFSSLISNYITNVIKDETKRYLADKADSIHVYLSVRLYSNNREVMDILSNEHLSIFVYNMLTKYVGTRYTSSIFGVSKWLSEPPEMLLWIRFFKYLQKIKTL